MLLPGGFDDDNCETQEDGRLGIMGMDRGVIGHSKSRPLRIDEAPWYKSWDPNAL